MSAATITLVLLVVSTTASLSALALSAWALFTVRDTWPLIQAILVFAKTEISAQRNASSEMQLALLRFAEDARDGALSATGLKPTRRRDADRSADALIDAMLGQASQGQSQRYGSAYDPTRAPDAEPAAQYGAGAPDRSAPQDDVSLDEMGDGIIDFSDLNLTQE